MTRLLRSETLPLDDESDLMIARGRVRECAVELDFGTLDMTRLVTVASELGRNTVIHGGGGSMLLEALAAEQRHGVRLTFEDKGAGIADLDLAMSDGFTTKGGMGLGLSGSRRLVDEFEIFTRVGEGTRVTVTRWK